VKKDWRSKPILNRARAYFGQGADDSALIGTRPYTLREDLVKIGRKILRNIYVKEVSIKPE
jgi:hypothetical protein